jgi:3-(3-hydroxy-phenyl)propionate hydroxylase
MKTHNVEVLVVGLGPVGSVAALHLAQHDIDVAAIETGATPAADLRASTFHSPTIEMLHAMGVTGTLLGQGLKAPIYQFRDRQSGDVYGFDLGELADRTAFPYRIQCEQHRVAQEIVAKLETYDNASPAYQRRLLYVEQDTDGVTAWVETGTAVEKYRARYLVAADGGNSVTRKLLDLGFPGLTYNEKFLCLSTDHPIEEAFDDLSYVNYVSDPNEWMVLLRVPGFWRILVPANEATPDAELLSDANKDAIMRRVLGAHYDPHMPIATRHRTIYRVHQRVCERFTVGRIGLVGDAVHLNSPVGGFGMNSGIHDAVNLCGKLVDILRHGADGPASLARYERQRRTVTENFVQTQTIENMKRMRDGWGSQRDAQRERMSRLVSDPDERRAFLMRQSMFTSLADAEAIA